jgi:hypothetical protein
MNLSNLVFDKKEEFTDGKYSVHSFSSPEKKFRRISCGEESICIIPFELNENNQIKNIFLLKYTDYLLDGEKFTCITKTFNQNKFDSYFLAVENYLHEKLGISELEVNDLYLLGKITHGIPFTKDYKCYGVNVTNFNSLAALSLSDPINSIQKVKFTKVINGDISDSLVLSSSLLLLSYFLD